MRNYLSALAAAVFEATEGLSNAERDSASCETCIVSDFEEQRRNLSATFYNFHAALEERERKIISLIASAEYYLSDQTDTNQQLLQEAIDEMEYEPSPTVDPTKGKKGPYR